MTAGTYNIVIEQGADFTLSLLYTGPSGSPIDLTGWSAEMMIRQLYSDPSPIVSLSSPANGIILGGAAGTILIEIAGAATAAFMAGVGCYDLKLSDVAGIPQRLIQGSVTISPAVTR